MNISQEVKYYIGVLNQNNVISTSHNILGRLWEKFGKEAVDEELSRQFEEKDKEKREKEAEFVRAFYARHGIEK
jgi:hypothetical protein